jgi:hypothetical protein
MEKIGGNQVEKIKLIFKHLAKWLDVIFLFPGMAFVAVGVSLVYLPAGYIVLGLCFLALAFFVANKQAKGDDN